MFSQELFCERLKKLREEKELSLSELGAKIGVSKHAIFDLEHGRRGTTMDKIYLLSEALDASSDYLLGLSDVRGRK